MGWSGDQDQIGDKFGVVFDIELCNGFGMWKIASCLAGGETWLFKLAEFNNSDWFSVRSAMCEGTRLCPRQSDQAAASRIFE
jgi:hypothetical protein